MARHWAPQDISANDLHESNFVARHRPRILPRRRFAGASLETTQDRLDSSNSDQESFTGIDWTGRALFGPWGEWRWL